MITKFYSTFLKKYIISPLTYIIAAIFFLLTGLYFSELSLLARISAIGPTINYMGKISIFFIPLLTAVGANPLQEQSKIDNDSQSKLQKIEKIKIKYFSLLFFLIIIILLSVIFPIILIYMESPQISILMSGYIGLLLYGISAITISFYGSLFSKNMIKSYLISFTLLVIFNITPILYSTLPPNISEILNMFSLYNRLQDFTLGIINIEYIIFYLSITSLFLILSYSKTIQVKQILKSLTLKTIITTVLIILLGILLYEASFSLDLTSNKRYSLSQNSKKILNKIDDKIEIYAYLDQRKASKVTIKILEKYPKVSDKIELKYLDRSNQQDRLIIDKYSLQDGNLLFKGNNKTILVNSSNLKIYQPSKQNYVHSGEKMFSNTIFNLIKNKNNYRLLFTRGGQNNTANDNYSKLKTLLQNEGYELKETALNNKIEPDKNGALVLTAPKKDLSDREIEIIDQFLNNGGDLLIAYPTTDETIHQLTNLNNYIKKWGVEKEDGIVVDKQSSFLLGPYSIIAEVSPHQAVRRLYKTKTHVLADKVSNLKIKETNDNRLSVGPLLKSSPYSWREQKYFGNTKYSVQTDNKEVNGPLTLAVGITKTSQISKIKKINQQRLLNSINQNNDSPINIKDYKSSNEDKTKIIILGSSSIVNDKFISQQGNRAFIINCIKWLTSTDQRLDIKSKVVGHKNISLTAIQEQILYYISVLFIPLICFITALIIWSIKFLIKF